MVVVVSEWTAVRSNNRSKSVSRVKNPEKKQTLFLFYDVSTFLKAGPEIIYSIYFHGIAMHFDCLLMGVFLMHVSVQVRLF